MADFDRCRQRSPRTTHQSSPSALGACIWINHDFTMNTRRYPPGRPPHDVLAGAKVGAITGALAGAAISALLSFAAFWLMVVGAVAGGWIGYRSQAARLRSFDE